MAAAVAKQEAKVDRVKEYLHSKALENVQAMQRDADTSHDTMDRFTIRKYLVGLAGYSEKQSIEHSGKVEFEPFIISRGDE